ncbi:MAG: hypothetical protein ACJ798_11915 [Phenylobacterium sp.]
MAGTYGAERGLNRLVSFTESVFAIALTRVYRFRNMAPAPPEDPSTARDQAGPWVEKNIATPQVLVTMRTPRQFQRQLHHAGRLVSGN